MTTLSSAVAMTVPKVAPPSFSCFNQAPPPQAAVMPEVEATKNEERTLAGTLVAEAVPSFLVGSVAELL